MKIDLEMKLVDPMGREFSDGATVKAAAYAALTNALPDDQQMSMEQKLKLYRLTQAIAMGGVVDLPAEDVVTIKTRASKSLQLVAFGALSDALDPKIEAVGMKA